MARHFLFAGLAAFLAAGLWGAVRPDLASSLTTARPMATDPGSYNRELAQAEDAVAENIPSADVADLVEKIDWAFREQWQAEQLRPAGRAANLTIARRLSLALIGTIPSLQEIRLLELQPSSQQITYWIDHLLADRRSADYLAERLARAYVGTEDGPFLVYRRRRFISWLADELAEDRPYDAIVREMIAAQGLWTDQPATNFITVTLTDGANRPDTARLAGRVARGFLGVRIDCAECHDHPFDRWKRSDFEGLATFFGEVRQTFTGIRDAPHADGEAEDKQSDHNAQAAAARDTNLQWTPPAVPFLAELLPTAGRDRQRLAEWITHRDNRHFARATVNRLWGQLFGRPLVEPVDNLPDNVPAVLDLLAEDFAAHGYDLRRLIRAMASAEVMALESRTVDDAEFADCHVAAWALFPLVRLRPEQTARAIFQARSLETVDRQAPLIWRFAQFTGQQEFVESTGDLAEDELAPETSTVSQRLLMMNGKAVRETTESNFFNASWRIAMLAPDDAAAIEAAYLTILTRRPTLEEQAYFGRRLSGTNRGERAARIEDLCWTLVNSMEFGWNH